MIADDRPRAWNSTLPRRSLPMPRSGWDRSVSGGGSLGRRARESGGRVVPMRSRPQPAPTTIPRDVLAAVDLRDGHFCVLCGRWREVIDHHHRRIKGMAGDVAEHTECCCNIVSACPFWTDSACHRLVHVKRRLIGEPRGLVVPRATPFPGLIAVTVASSEDGSLRDAWPTCEGRWTFDEPDGAAA